MRKRWQSAMAALVVGVAGLSAPVQAQDFFSNLFGGFGARAFAPRHQMIVMPYGDDGQPIDAPRPRAGYGSYGYGGGQAWCVRTCDGRYFPLASNDAQGKAESCNSFCPASSTEVVYGGDIDHASTQSGKPYSQLQNAFKYRTELVAGCTCNGKDPVGLASVAIDKDPTLRKGDIVAGADGLVIANPGSGRHAELNFTPVPESIRARYRRAPVLARE